MEKLICAFIILLTVLSFFGCSEKSSKGDSLSYEEKGFLADIEVISEGFAFSAHMEGEPWEKESGNDRDFSLTFTFPKTLAGIEAVKKDGILTLTLDGCSIPDTSGAFTPLTSFTELFEINSAPVSFEHSDKSTRAVYTGSDGGEIFLTLSENGLPKEIRNSRTLIKIAEYKAIN